MRTILVYVHEIIIVVVSLYTSYFVNVHFATFVLAYKTQT